MVSWKSISVIGALAAVVAASTPSCGMSNNDSKCPQDSPCCTYYGTCGTGSACLGGATQDFHST